MKQLTVAPRRASSSPNAAPVLQKADHFPTEQRIKWRRSAMSYLSWCLFISFYLKCKKRFEHCWAHLCALGLLQSVSCTIQTKCFHLEQHPVYLIPLKPCCLIQLLIWNNVLLNFKCFPLYTMHIMFGLHNSLHKWSLESKWQIAEWLLD